MTYIYLLELPPQRLFDSDACSIFQDTSAELIWAAAQIWSFMAAIHFFVCSQYVFMCDTIECEVNTVGSISDCQTGGPAFNP